ncbi:MAG: hypothetical protein HY074_07055 [Deltaproteobacteria bacterium]|nr:hypothetical protein [Deltaproteobacteria bacterium]
MFKFLSFGLLIAAFAAPTVTVKLRLGDRFFIESVLTDIFGPAATVTTTKYIFKPASLYGGPCDIYEQVRIGQGAQDFADPRGACPGGKTAASLLVVGVSSMLRQGYVTRACELLATQPATLEYALRRLFPDGVYESPNPMNLAAAFQLFNPERNPSPGIVAALQQLESREPDLKKRWSLIYLTLCMDPQWQVI